MSKTMAVFSLSGTDEFITTEGKFSIDENDILTPLDDKAKSNIEQTQKELHSLVIVRHGDFALWLRNSPSVIVHENNYDYKDRAVPGRIY